MTTQGVEQPVDNQKSDKAETKDTKNQSVLREIGVWGLQAALRIVVAGIVVVGGKHYLDSHPNVIGDSFGSQLNSLLTQVQRTPQLRELSAKMDEKHRLCEAALHEARTVRSACNRIVPNIETASPTQISRAGLCMQQAQFAATMANTACGF